MQCLRICCELKFFRAFVVGKVSDNEKVARVGRSGIANRFNLSD